jgi:hypothetical protein
MTFSNVTDQPLADKQCFLIANGVAVEGPVVLWRTPNQVPWDIELHECVRPDPGAVRGLTDNSLYLSRDGHGNSVMAGGDFDGDLDAVSANQELLKFVVFTQPDVDLIARKTLEQEVEEELPAMVQETFFAAEQRERVREFVSFARKMFTGDVRGRVANMASRAARALFTSGDPLADGDLYKVLRMCILSHAAMDAPKKRCPAQVLRACSRLAAAAGVRRTDPKATDDLATELKFEIPGLKRTDVLGTTEALLEGKVPGAARGTAWLPEREIVLGHDAGVLLGRAMRNRPERIARDHREFRRSPVVDIANVFLHKIFGREKIPTGNVFVDMEIGQVRKRMRTVRSTPIRSFSGLQRSHLG